LKILRMLRSNMRRAIINKRFIIAVLLIAIFEYMDVFHLIYSNYADGSSSDMAGYTLVELLLSTGVTMFWGMSITVCLMPYSCAYIEDEENNSVTYMSVRSSKVLYSVSTVLTCGLSAFLCVVLGKVLFFIISSFSCDVCNPYTLEMYGDFITSLSEGNYWGFIAGNVILCGLRGSFFALVGMLTSCYVKNKMVIYSTPILLFYFFTKFGYFNLHLPEYLDIVAIYMTYVFGNKHELFSILYAFAFTLCVGVITAYSVNREVRRRY